LAFVESQNPDGVAFWLLRENSPKKELFGSPQATAQIAASASLDGRYALTSSIEKEVGGARMTLLVGNSQRSVPVAG
jgi:hypothetical protein